MLTRVLCSSHHRDVSSEQTGMYSVMVDYVVVKVYMRFEGS